jgi:hypothetical protein
MRPFDYRAFASKQPALAIIIPDRDLHSSGQGGKQVRVFTKGQEYKLTRKLNEWDICVVNNEGLEVQLAAWSQYFTYNTGEPLSTYFKTAKSKTYENNISRGSV